MSLLPHEKPIAEYEKTLAQLKEQGQVSAALLSEAEIAQLEQKLQDLKKRVYSQLTPWERVAICRHAARPKTLNYIRHICEEFTELHGDRNFADDRSIVAGLGKIGGQKFMIIGHEKGHDTESRIKHNFGMPHPEGYRKALRCMRLAAKFRLLVLTLIDTPGANPTLAAEERGQGWAIAENLREMASLPTPILVLIIGEGCSGGALGIGVGDVVGMLEHAYYSVISPEGCSSILFKDSARKADAAGLLKMHAEDLLRFGVIDEIISEPSGGAHHNPEQVYRDVRSFVLRHAATLNTLTVPELLAARYEKFRKLGACELT